jgi:hypothetical protein
MSLALIFCREIFTMHRPAILMMVSPIATGRTSVLVGDFKMGIKAAVR